MKYPLLIVFSLVYCILQAQIQVLPDMEVTGESQVKIFLYKKALPYSPQSTLNDSLQAFLPLSYPMEPVPHAGAKTKSSRSYIHIQGGSIGEASAIFRHHFMLKYLNAAGLCASFKSPKSELISRNISLNADLRPAVSHTLILDAHLQKVETADMQSSFRMGQLHLGGRDFSALDLDFREMSNELRFYSLDQKYLPSSFSSEGVAWHHESTVKLADLLLGNSVYLYGPKPVIGSQLELNGDYIDRYSIGAIYDGMYLMPALSFNHTIDTGYDSALKISNRAHTALQDYQELLHQYTWILMDERLRNTTVPLEFCLEYAMINPEVQDVHPVSVSVKNTTSFSKNKALLAESDMPDVVEFVYDDVFENRSSLAAVFGSSPFKVIQNMAVSLAYETRHDWRSLAYNRMLQLESTAKYERSPYHGQISFVQQYFAKDQAQRDLPELLDLNLEFGADIGSNGQLYIGLDNLLNSNKRVHRALPKQRRHLYLGLLHRF